MILAGPCRVCFGGNGLLCGNCLNLVEKERITVLNGLLRRRASALADFEAGYARKVRLIGKLSLILAEIPFLQNKRHEQDIERQRREVNLQNMSACSRMMEHQLQAGLRSAHVGPGVVSHD